ncbi:MAG: alpha-galactosidase [Lachnospiraceae bacterium]|nr:alpha-galactosidase [Lachnospiraceae bacterium]
MSIIFNEKQKTFSLHTKNTTYQMKIGNLDYLIHTYYGPSIPDEDVSYQIKQYDRGFSGNPIESIQDRTFSLDAQPQEFSTYQQGDFRTSSMEVVNADGSMVFGGKVKDYRIKTGKFTLDGLPTCFATEKDTVDTLEITLADPVSLVEVTLLYSVFEEKDIITRSTLVYNAGSGTIHLRKIMASCLDFTNGSDKDIVSFPGRYGQEKQVERMCVNHHIHRFESGRGSSSHQQSPYLILCDHDATEDFGTCYGMAMMYSGNFLAEVELDQYDQLRVQMGINNKNFNFLLEAGERFTAPEVVMTCTEKGLTGITHIYHDFIRSNLNRSKFMHEERPILINTWEAVFFDFDDKKLVEVAKAAKKMGVEMLVMDDGWFGKRDNDKSGLGDWFVNRNKIHCGLHDLVKQVNELDMKFGIWFEPEMVSVDSDLYRKHPDWAMEIPGRDAIVSREQLALDISRRDVQDYLIESVNAILDDANIAYMKWDINRSVTDLWSNALASERQGELAHRMVLGLYRIMDGIIKTHPDILFEGCSGGGGRFDLAMLSYYPQYWSSDNTKPIDNLKLHYGASFLYPPCTQGAHVSDSTAYVPFDTKAVIAMGGTFGYELDATHLEPEILAGCQKMSKRFKKYFKLISEGDYYRLTNPFSTGNFTAWQSVSKDKKESLLSIVITNQTVNGPQEYVKVKGLDKDLQYTVSGDIAGSVIVSGAALMRVGIPVPRDVQDYSAFQIEIKA